MTRASLRPYLSPIPLFRYLSFDQQIRIAQKLVSKQLKGGETLDLRGSYANVLCIVTRGKVKVETRLQGNHTLRCELTAGQWTGQARIIGWGQALRTQITADEGDAGVLLLWQQDLAATPIFRELFLLTRTVSSPFSQLRSATVWVLPRTASALEFLGSKALEHPIVLGTIIALVLFMSFLLFTTLGKQLRADWWYVTTVHQTHLSPESRSHQLSRILQMVPNHPSANVELGNMAVQSGDLEAAMLRYATVADMSGAGANNMGVLLLNRGDPETALQMLGLSTQLEPDLAVSYQNLGIAYQQLGQQLEATRASKEALRIDPSFTVARYHLGMYYLGQDNLVQAGASFERVLEQDTTCAPAYIGLGLVHIRIGDLERAVYAFQEATRHDPDSVVAHFYLGWSQTQMGDKAEAETALTQVLSLHPPQDLADRVSIMLSEGANNSTEEVPMYSKP